MYRALAFLTGFIVAIIIVCFESRPSVSLVCYLFGIIAGAFIVVHHVRGGE